MTRLAQPTLRPTRHGQRPGTSGWWLRVLAIVLGAAAGVVAVNLAPRWRRAPSDAFIGPATGDVILDLAVEAFVSGLDDARAEQLAEDIADYREEPVRHVRPTSWHIGDGREPVRMVLWLDLLAPHGAEIGEALLMLRTTVPPRSLALSLRPYPLDAACNPAAEERHDREHLRCLAAKLLLCVPQESAFDIVNQVVRGPRKLTSLQPLHAHTTSTLTAADLLALASTVRERRELEDCIASTQTAQALADSVTDAAAAGLKAPPLLVINDRHACHDVDLIRAAVLTRGTLLHPAFRALPAP